jgi:hypothetical protein
VGSIPPGGTISKRQGGADYGSALCRSGPGEIG